MATFEQHCLDCEKLLGNRHEDVNRWVDGLFWKLGPRHRRMRHNTHGVRLAGELFGPEGAKAAIVHIVRDVGAVPNERDYNTFPEGIEVAPGFVAPTLGYEQFWDEFRAKAEEEIKRVLGAQHVRLAQLAEHPGRLPVVRGPTGSAGSLCRMRRSGEDQARDS